MMTPSYLQQARDFLKISHPLATGPNKRNSRFGKILEGVFRKGYFTLQTIVFLADMVEKDDQFRIIFGGSWSNEDTILALVMLNIGFTFTIVIILAQLYSDHNHLRTQFNSLVGDFKQHKSEFSGLANNFKLHRFEFKELSNTLKTRISKHR